MSEKKSIWSKIGNTLIKNNVTVLFVLLCVGAFFASTYTLPSLFTELFTRLGRNTFLVLSLLIPVVAGLGLNFGIVIGAIAAQIAIFLVVHWGFTGFSGILMTVLICTPLAVLFGFLVGKLFNSMKGTEMIGGLVAGYFSDGLYQLLFLVILGGVIPINNSTLMISTGMGVKNVINLKDNLRYAIDEVSMLSIINVAFYAGILIGVILIVYRLIKKQDLQLKKLLTVLIPVIALYGISYVPAIRTFLSTPRLMLLNAVELGVIGVALFNIYKLIRLTAIEKKQGVPIKQLLYIAGAGAVYASTYISVIYQSLCAVHLPVLTFMLIGALCLFMPWLMNTKLGQDMRTVGQNRAVATSSGINVNRVRIIAMILSTVLASYGQLISLQNIGTVATYGSHQQVGLYAIAALLVGGASVQHATVKHALLGMVLFHTLFILSPNAGQQLLGNAQIGEYFRVFVAYGVIALALAMHAWSNRGPKKQRGTLVR
ncbi:ABC transporter permease [Eubacteriales bacterium OttesenSCG-928-K08]|nr:ABC transporter permease [Eubacteriales bacterium OttesenSCG-928-K08]